MAIKPLAIATVLSYWNGIATGSTVVAMRGLGKRAFGFPSNKSVWGGHIFEFEYFARIASTRIIQLVGNLLKPIFYLDLRLRPGKRYEIPNVSPALLRGGEARAIPRIVWLTNKTGLVTLSLYVNFHFNRLMAPTFEFRFCDDDGCHQFIETHRPAMLPVFSRLTIGAAKADLWRIIVLEACGGVYLDIDASFSWPLEWTIGSKDCLFTREKDGKLTNYFMASKPGHPVLTGIAEAIAGNIEANMIATVYDMTGPTVVDRIAGRARVPIEPSKIVCRQGQFTKKEFQYPDNLKGYWALEEKRISIVRPCGDHSGPVTPTLSDDAAG